MCEKHQIIVILMQLVEKNKFIWYNRKKDIEVSSMESSEKLDLLEELLQLPNGSLTEETYLEDVDGWDSVTMANLQTEFAMRGIDIPLEELEKFERVSELCRLIK